MVSPFQYKHQPIFSLEIDYHRCPLRNQNHSQSHDALVDFGSNMILNRRL